MIFDVLPMLMNERKKSSSSSYLLFSAHLIMGIHFTRSINNNHAV